MTDATADTAAGTDKVRGPATVSQALLKRRHAAEFRFKLYGQLAIGFAMLMLLIMLTSIVSKGYSAFFATYLQLEVTLDAESLGVTADSTEKELEIANYGAVVRDGLRARFPEVTGRRERRDLNGIVSGAADLQLRDMVLTDPSIIGSTVTLWFPADDDIDMLNKGVIDTSVPEADRPVKDNAIGWYDDLREAGQIETRFNSILFTAGASRSAEQAGLLSALVGSMFTMLVTLLLTFPIGVAASIYLEEFAPKNKITDLIEVNINNLAAVPSIVFGLLGLAVFLGFFGLPRSAPLVGGMVLALMTLPTIIIASRAALKAVPPSIRDGALAMGASKMQTITQQVLPLAMPGILTGTIIGMAQALGETAPLLMIGMVAFIVDIPGGFTDPATVLPVQIYLWADMPERAFVEKTSGAIMVLLGFLIMMNMLAILLRKRFERRW